MFKYLGYSEEDLNVKVHELKMLKEKQVAQFQSGFFMIVTLFITDLFYSAVMSLSQLDYFYFLHPQNSFTLTFSNLIVHVVFVIVVLQVTLVVELNFKNKLKAFDEPSDASKIKINSAGHLGGKEVS